MSCLKCGGIVLLDQGENNTMAILLHLGRVAYCLNCGIRYYEKIAKRRIKLAMHDPYHRSLRV